MDELYSGNTSNIKMTYDTSNESEDANREFYREFDYGIDSTADVN